jgi:hypothetical protein
MSIDWAKLRREQHRIAMQYFLQEKNMPKTAEATTIPADDARETKLAKIFHMAFRNQQLAPDWERASHKYRLAVAAGVRAVLAEIGIK